MPSTAHTKQECPHCGAQFDGRGELAGRLGDCPACRAPLDSLDQVPRRGLPRLISYGWIVIGACLFLGAGAWWFASRTAPDAAPTLVPSPPPADLQRMNRLAFWDFSFERTEGSAVTHVLAHVVNESAETRYGIEVRLELQDGLGRVVGTARDYLERLDPGGDARLKALVLKPGSVSARVIQVTEH